MNFSTGNSGNDLKAAVIKTGEGCQQEGAFCQHLGTEIAPEIYAIIPNGYVMEALEPATRNKDLLRRIEMNLHSFVWSRPALPSTADTDWRDFLSQYGISDPHKMLSPACLVHGDPTASNALLRTTFIPHREVIHRLILGDPRAPRAYVPQVRETDMGRILQSYYGWEVAAYDAEPVSFTKPGFMLNPWWAERAHFWCGAAVARIEHQERSRPTPRRKVLDWCCETRGKCNV